MEEYVNKIVVKGETRLDLTEDTAEANDVRKGKTFHLKSGAPATGTMQGMEDVDVSGDGVVNLEWTEEHDLHASHSSSGVVPGSYGPANDIVADFGQQLEIAWTDISQEGHVSDAATMHVTLPTIERITNQMIDSICV